MIILILVIPLGIELWKTKQGQACLLRIPALSDIVVAKNPGKSNQGDISFKKCIKFWALTPNQVEP